jgi:hypothetical protein
MTDNAVGLLALDGPRHDLQDLPWRVVGVVPGSQRRDEIMQR